MLHLLKESRYHQILGLLYLIFTLYVLFVTPELVSFTVPGQNIVPALIITAAAITGLILWRICIVGASFVLQAPTLISSFLYSLLTAIPEELLFRAFAHDWLEQYLEYPFLIVLVSSLLFGIAHLPNSAAGMAPSQWNWKFGVIAFMAGIPLGVLFIITESLFFPIMLHVVLLMCFRVFAKM